jgi:MoaA/NifB/PqqE/SkfB family radical SAM enzyme
MTMDIYRRLLPALKKSQLAYLQGWGEPFLHPDFFTLVSLAKQAGCLVGTTSNGKQMKEDTLARIVDSGIDILAFSLACANETNDSIRRGTSFEQILAAIRTLNQMKKEKNTGNPAIHIAYLLLRSQLDEVKKILSLLKGKGIHQLVITTLDFAPSREVAVEMVFPETDEEWNALNSLLDSVVEEGRKNDLPIHYYLAHPNRPQTVCTENVRRALFVSADGAVSPCVFMNLPVADVTYFAKGEEREYQRLVFGRIQDESFANIWNRKSYVDFRRSFETGCLHDFCKDCCKRFTILT